MYGLVLDSMADCVKRLYGEDIWFSVVGSTDISNTMFTTYKIYDEQLIPMIAKSISELTGNSIEEVMEAAGKHFIVYIDVIRNDRILKVLGRTFKDFLNSLDSMHEYLKFSFTDIQAPSFQVRREDCDGLELHYRSRRSFTGFMYYVKGLVWAIASKFYNIDVSIQIVKHGFTGDVMLAIYRLTYNNEDFLKIQKQVTKKNINRRKNGLVFPTNTFLELFPYHVVFDEMLKIINTGHGLDIVAGKLEGKRLNETFFLTRPLGYDLTWDSVHIHRNNVFELTSVKSVAPKSAICSSNQRMCKTYFIKLRGQMIHVEDWQCVIFLATLKNEDLEKMNDMGLYMNDFTFHDLSRDNVLHGIQQNTKYKLALDLERGKTARLQESIDKSREDQRKTDDLLYSRIPKQLASSLRQGNTSVNLCELFPEVTVLFSDVVGFGAISNRITPQQTLTLINKIISIFDILCNVYNSYKVETVADGFMCVSGAPAYDELHVKHLTDMAIAMLMRIKNVRDPSTGEAIQLRIGMHCGPAIAGLVGHKIPRYCLFGDTVHIASTLEKTGMTQRIHISHNAVEKLMACKEYIIEKKDLVAIKGCPPIETYWLNRKPELKDLDVNITEASQSNLEQADQTEITCNEEFLKSINSVRLSHNEEGSVIDNETEDNLLDLGQKGYMENEEDVMALMMANMSKNNIDNFEIFTNPKDLRIEIDANDHEHKTQQTPDDTDDRIPAKHTTDEDLGDGHGVESRKNSISCEDSLRPMSFTKSRNFNEKQQCNEPVISASTKYEGKDKRMSMDAIQLPVDRQKLDISSTKVATTNEEKMTNKSYHNLMQIIGLETKCEVILDQNNTILSAKRKSMCPPKEVNENIGKITHQPKSVERAYTCMGKVTIQGKKVGPKNQVPQQLQSSVCVLL